MTARRYVAPRLARARLHALGLYAQRTSCPILIGPFTSEVGFEALYWIPMLQRWRQRYAIATERVHVVSRGGAGRWYGVPLAQTLDLYDLSTIEEVRIQNSVGAARTGSLKQETVTTYDQAMMRLACRRWGLTWASAVWLHPRAMYVGLSPWWREDAGIGLVAAQTRYSPIDPGPPPAGWRLPAEYVCARFYARATFGLTAETMDFVAKTIERLAARVPVIDLSPQLYADEHVDFRITGTNVWALPAHEANQNLAVQAAVLARATGYIGTYGGMAQLALRLGVPSVSMYAGAWHGTAVAHLLLSHQIAVKTGVGFTVLSLEQMAMARGLLTT